LRTQFSRHRKEATKPGRGSRLARSNAAVGIETMTHAIGATTRTDVLTPGAVIIVAETNDAVMTGGPMIGVAMIGMLMTAVATAVGVMIAASTIAAASTTAAARIRVLVAASVAPDGATTASLVATVMTMIRSRARVGRILGGPTVTTTGVSTAREEVTAIATESASPIETAQAPRAIVMGLLTFVAAVRMIAIAPCTTDHGAAIITTVTTEDEGTVTLVMSTAVTQVLAMGKL